MDFELDDAQRAWVAEVRQFLDENVTAALRAEMAEHGLEYQGGELTAFRRKIGEKGWFGLNWPQEYGGLGLTATHQHLLMTEFEYVGVPGPDLTVTSVAPMIMRHGTEQNKKEFLPGIARGEIVFALGYSEPNAGTDLASLRTRAVRDGDEWVINGSKIWNSGAQRSTHEWLCVRTDPDAPRHRGISVIIPFSTPHIVAMVRYSPVWTRCSIASRSDSASFDPFATGHPYGAVSKISPAGSNTPPDVLIANPVAGESADIASTSPLFNAAFRSSWLTKTTFLIAGLPASSHALLLAGTSSVS